MAKPIVIKVTGDDKGFQKSMGRVDKGIGGMTSGVTKAAGLIGGAFAVAGVASFAGDMFNLGSELEVMGKKAETVFGGELGRVEEWAGGAAAKMGLTRNELVGLTTAAADLLKPMGFNAEQAADLSTEMTGLAGALAMNSQGKVDSAGASEVLQKALLGERDGLQALGIKIDEEMLKARLLADGKADLTGEALKQARAEATLALITEQSTDAITSYAAADDTLLVQKNKLNAKVGELKESIAVGLTPAFAAIAGFLVDEMIPVLEDLYGWFEDNILPTIKTVASFIKDDLLGAFTGMSDTVDGDVNPILESLRDLFNNGLKPAFEAIVDYVQTGLLPTLQALWTIFNEKIWPVLEQFVIPTLLWLAELLLGEVLPALVEVQKFILEGVVLAIETFFESLESLIGFVQDVIDIGGDLVDMFEELPGKIRDAAAGLWDGIPKPPSFITDGIGAIGGVFGLAHGGTANQTGSYLVGERGPELVSLPSGANVTPNHELGSTAGGVVVNVTTQADPWQVGREVAWAIRTGGV